jgi:hypothetical protein
VPAKNVILIYANCNNPTAKGDFTFAGNIAKDLVYGLRSGLGQGLPIDDVILVSTEAGLPRFIALYGQPDNNGRIQIGREDIGLSSLEKLDPFQIHVVAFIEANRCKFAESKLIQRLVSPSTKFLFIGNANQSQMTEGLKAFYYTMLHSYQRNLYNYFAADDLLVTNAGFGTGRIGLPSITDLHSLPPIAEAENDLFPRSAAYGFMYVNAVHASKDYTLIAQYVRLSGLKEYVLVGKFTDKQQELQATYQLEAGPDATLPTIQYYQSLPNHVMRRMVAETSSPLVVSTGVISTLEAMQDGKLTFYQDLKINESFVTTYLAAVNDLISADPNNDSLVVVFELSGFLFAPKPLSKPDMKRMATLLQDKEASNELIGFNQKILRQAYGTLVPTVLDFIQRPKTTEDQKQLEEALKTTGRLGDGEVQTPVEALHRAIRCNNLLLLRILIKNYPAEINLPDLSNTGGTVLHTAVLNEKVEAAQLLLQHGANAALRNDMGQTPLHIAIAQGNQPMIDMFLKAGVSPLITNAGGRLASLPRIEVIADPIDASDASDPTLDAPPTIGARSSSSIISSNRMSSAASDSLENLPPINATLFMKIMTVINHPITRAVASFIAVVGIVGITLGTLGIAGAAMPIVIAGAVATSLGVGGLLTSGIFSCAMRARANKIRYESDASADPAPPGGANPAPVPT